MEQYEYIAHHGIKGQRWGFRRFQNPDGSLTPEGRARYLGEPNPNPRKNQTVFVSGSSKTQDKSSGYYRKRLPSGVRYELKEHMKRGDKIIVGDAPGIDRQTQDYLAKKGYKNVEVFSPGKEGARYLADKGWKQTNVDAPGAEIGSKEWLAAKDFVMSKLADTGIAVTIDEGATATRKNVDRLVEANKEVSVYELGRDKGFLGNLLGRREDKSTTFINGKEVSEGYYDGYWITDPDNKSGVIPEHEYGTRTRDISATRIAKENPNTAYIRLHNAGFRPSEIAKVLGQSTKDDGKPSGETRKWAAKYKVNKNDIAALKARQHRAQSLKSSGNTIAEIADIMGDSVSNIKDYLYEDFDSLR